MAGASQTPVLSLMSMLGATTERARSTFSSEENADSYWQRSDQFDMGLDLTGGTRGPAALAQAMARWISHLLGIDVGNRAAHRTARCKAHLVCRARFRGHPDRRPALAWRSAGRAHRRPRAGAVPAHFSRSSLVADACRARAGLSDPCHDIRIRCVRMKPQNLLTGLPIKHLEAAT